MPFPNDAFFPGTQTWDGVQWWTESLIDPDSWEAADGSLWWSVVMNNTSGMFYTVWKEFPEGKFEMLWHAPVAGQHRGRAHGQNNGKFSVTRYSSSGDRDSIVRSVIPGYFSLLSNDPRIRALQETVKLQAQQISSLSDRLTALQNQVSQMSGGTLTPEETDTLRWAAEYREARKSLPE